jgi:hypothetical protein
MAAITIASMLMGRMTGSLFHSGLAFLLWCSLSVLIVYLSLKTILGIRGRRFVLRNEGQGSCPCMLSRGIPAFLSLIWINDNVPGQGYGAATKTIAGMYNARPESPNHPCNWR